MSAALATPRLRRLAAGARPRPAPAAEERCGLCGAPVPPPHRHLVDVARRTLVCACRACAVLFDRRAAGGGHYRLVPERHVRLDGFVLDDATWDALAIPVDVAFFFRSTPAGRVVAFYPSPLGAVESALPLDAWAALEAANPLLATLEPDVEALLVNRARGARADWIVPVDACYRLVGLVRTRWKGLGGGEAWRDIGEFFAALETRAAHHREGGAT